MNSALLDHNTPEQVLHHVVNDPNISLADFRALTLAVVVNSAPFCYFTAKGHERNKEDILSHIERYKSNSITHELLFGVASGLMVAMAIQDHETAREKVTAAVINHDDMALQNT